MCVCVSVCVSHAVYIAFGHRIGTAENVNVSQSFCFCFRDTKIITLVVKCNFEREMERREIVF